MAREYDHLFKLLIIGDSGKEIAYEAIKSIVYVAVN